MNGVAVIDRAKALAQTARSLGLTPDSASMSSQSRAILAQSLRRASFNAAPCAAQVLRALVFAVQSPLTDDTDSLKAQIESALDDLIAIGDILEMRSDSEARSDLVLRPAPPAFVVRRDGSFIIIGVAGDEITPFSEPPIVHHESGLRSICPADAQTYRSELLGLGLIELPERLWLFAPAAVSAADVVAHWKARLPVDVRPEKIEDLEILDGASTTTFYKGRWSALHPKHAGIFVARRRQRYGAKLWCLVDVKDGLVQRLVDIRARDCRTRDCDEAWRLQAAIDASAGTPQGVRVSSTEAATTLAFSSPLPAWAARRLSFIGNQVASPHALLAFEIPTENAQEELQWLGENLWLARNDEERIA